MMIQNLQKKFNNKELLTRALTHKSWLNENGATSGSYERLEFLGDAVLELVVSRALFEHYPDKQEGVLTLARSSIVNNKGNLAVIARKLNLGQELILGKGEEAVGGRDKSSILADIMEAIIGAIYLDLGLEEASKFIEKHILADMPENLQEQLKDPKTLLQERAQAKNLPTPRYEVVSEKGPDHSKTFEIAVKMRGKLYGKGAGSSKLEAEKIAAANTLDELDL